ncbi:hypothetical protein ACROYT_G031986 [Oculina patagonica]
MCSEAERSQRGYALLNTTFSSKPTDSYPTCLELCLDDPRCISFNFWWSTRQCDLNSWSREICQACYVPASSTYMEMTSLKGKKGSLATVPGLSCKDIKDSEDLGTSGTYWVRPAGSDVSFQGYCDMSAIGKWIRITHSWIDSTLKGGATVTYSEVNNGLVISGHMTSYGCGSEEQPGILTYIKGYWTKIKYTQEFRGVSSCFSIFGDNWYGRTSVNNEPIGVHPFNATQGDSITDQYNMGGNWKKGTLSTVPGLSCKDIKNSEDLNTSGTYWIRPAGSDVSFQGYCDMSAIGKWTRVTYSWIDSTLTGGATLTYSEENNGLAISVQITSQGCGKEEEGGVLTFIKGYWTKIKYTQVFRRETGCWSIFGNTGYGHESVNNELPGLYPFSADEGDSITNQYYMGGNSHEFEGLTKQCNTLETNFWRNPNPSVRYATVTLRRQLTAEKAGIFTGTSCGTPTFKIKDIY